MTKIQKTIDGKVYDFWKYTEEELQQLKSKNEKRLTEIKARKSKINSIESINS